MSEKEILMKAAYAAVREMESCASGMPVTFGTAINAVFNAVLSSGSVVISPADLKAFQQSAEEIKDG